MAKFFDMAESSVRWDIRSRSRLSRSSRCAMLSIIWPLNDGPLVALALAAGVVFVGSVDRWRAVELPRTMHAGRREGAPVGALKRPKPLGVLVASCDMVPYVAHAQLAWDIGNLELYRSHAGSLGPFCRFSDLERVREGPGKNEAGNLYLNGRREKRMDPT
jgi:hypothetical protein